MLSPLGFGTWQAGATLIPGFLAKEVIISSMAILYSSNENGLVNVIQHQFTSLSAYAFMIFILLYVPCISTVATIRKETCSWKWTLIALFYPIVTAYLLTLAFYQISNLLYKDDFMYIFINILIIVVIIFYTVLTLVKFFKRSKEGGNAEVANLIVIVIQRHIRNI